MKTMTFKSNRSAMVEECGKEFVDRWAEALMTSKQHKCEMVSEDGESMCCLAVASTLEGATADDMLHGFHPSTPRARKAADVTLAFLRGEEMLPENLNDCYLTHPQIAALLRGDDVTSEVS